MDAERLRTPDVRAAQIVVVPIVHFVADHIPDFGSDAADVPALPDVHLGQAIGRFIVGGQGKRSLADMRDAVFARAQAVLMRGIVDEFRAAHAVIVRRVGN